MDGARFSNAVVALGCTPAEMTWKPGVDLLSLGGTKNGCWCAEAIIVMDPAKSKIVPHLRKRGGQLFSKSRFVAAQFDAWLENDLWKTMATHANAMADRLRALVAASNSMRLAWPTFGNQSFIIMKKAKAETLLAARGAVLRMGSPGRSRSRGRGGRSDLPIHHLLRDHDGRYRLLRHGRPLITKPSTVNAAK